ncbi:hypothetical protein [Enterobacter hormaechei]|uniref:hypothetical protein n=1 Tax=Enterobacter hormaechei TaxID=158836 RepID=UPI003BB87975
MSNIDKNSLTEESARESGNILLIVAARMARGELFTPLRYVSELPQKAIGMRTFRDALEWSEETLQREVHKIVDGHGRMAKKLRETEEKLEAAEKRIAELEAREVKLPAEKFCPAEYAGSQLWEETEIWNKAVQSCEDAIRTEGIKVTAAGKGEAS